MKRQGICSVCGCTEDEACAQGCSWANLKKTLCTACEPLPDRLRREKRQQALTELSRRLESLGAAILRNDDRARAIRLRMEVLQS